MIFAIIGIVFVILKLLNITRVRNWNWWSVVSPFWLYGVILSALFISNPSLYPYSLTNVAAIFTGTVVMLSCTGYMLKGFGMWDYKWYWIALPSFVCLLPWALVLLHRALS